MFCVDIIRTDIEGIAGVGGEDRRRTEGAAQLADLGLQGVDRVRRCPSPHSASISRSTLTGCPR
jgi:hypothetical protein